VFALFPDVTHLDFTGPHQILCRLPGAQVVVASEAGGEIEADGLVFAHLARLADIEHCDLLCVPGGFGTTQAMADEAFLTQIRRLAAGARYVTSVCTGSLLLGAAGLLKASGRPATGPGATSWPCSARRPTRPGWRATAMSSPAAG
jgi:cyclohexyl-isocyanide hydratase